MKKEMVILDEDKAYARIRIIELERAIQDLGPEFYEAFNQSSETWHDNAPFDALRDRQSVLDAELQQLKVILRSSVPSVPPQKRGVVGIGSVVELRDARANVTLKYFVAGDWTPHAGQMKNDAVVISRQTPLAGLLINKKIGDKLAIRDRIVTIVSITASP